MSPYPGHVFGQPPPRRRHRPVECSPHRPRDSIDAFVVVVAVVVSAVVAVVVVAAVGADDDAALPRSHLLPLLPPLPPRSVNLQE